jgi:hypothetical protein
MSQAKLAAAGLLGALLGAAITAALFMTKEGSGDAVVSEAALPGSSSRASSSTLEAALM